MEKPAVYRAGVIGLGVMGSIADGLGGKHPIWFRPCSHADLYEQHERTLLVAGSTRAPARQERFKEMFQGRPVYADYQQMLAQEALDLVSISTPATCHAQMVIAAAQAGVKGIYCEKAMACSLAECDAMINACAAAGTRLIINHQRRWDDRFIALKAALTSGAIGDLQSIQISFGGNRLCRGGSHMFDLALMLCDDEVINGYGWLSNPDDFDPGGVGLFETREGVRIFIDGCKGMGHLYQADVIGEKGVLRMVDGGFEFELWTKDAESEFGHMAKRHLPVNFAVGNPMHNALDDLIASLETDREPRSTGLDGRKALEMIVAIHLSQRAKRDTIRFPLEDMDFSVPSN